MDDPIRVPAGKTAEISLQANPAAGYTWEAELPAESAELLELLGVDWGAPSHASSLAGAPSVQTFRFRAVAAGNATVLFRYRRSWESKSSDEKRVLFRIED
jgi:predicted secreted protein